MFSKKLWTPQQVTLLKEHYPDRTYALRVLEKQLHKSIPAIMNKAFQLRLKRHKIKTSELHIIGRYKSGATCIGIAKEIQCGISTIIRVLHKNKIKQRPDKYVSNKKYAVNHRCFDKINSQEKAYFLGLLYADGNIHNNVLSISLLATDREILEQFRHFLKTDKPLVPVPAKGRDKPQLRFSVSNEHMANSLKNVGVVERKSLTLKFPKGLSKELVPHFIRGYFDGDGCITTDCKHKGYKLSFCGTKEFLNAIQNIFKRQFGIPFRKLYRKKRIKVNSYSLEYTGRIMVDNILSWLYNNSKICLKRKLNKYKNLKSSALKSVKKGMHYRKTAVPLNLSHIRQLRQLRKKGARYKQLSEQFEISTSTVNNILNRRIEKYQHD